MKNDLIERLQNWNHGIPKTMIVSEAIAEIERLRASLAQIAIVCTDNMDANCNHRMALDFVRQIANDADQQKAQTDA